MLMMINLLHKIKNLLLFLLPVIYIIYIVYIRLILVRDPRVLFVKLSSLQISITIFIVIGIVLRIYFLLKKEGIIKEKEKKSVLSLWLIAKLTVMSKAVNNIWVDFYRFFFSTAVRMHLLVLRFAVFLGNHKTPKFALTVIIIMLVLPKVLILLAFIIDIFVFHKFYYFYKALCLLLLPLCYSTLRAILSQFYEDNTALFDFFIERTYLISDCGNFFRVKYDFAEGYERPAFVKDLDDFLENHFFPIINIKDILGFYEAAISYYKINWIFLLILVLHLIGWLTILFFGM